MTTSLRRPVFSVATSFSISAIMAVRALERLGRRQCPACTAGVDLGGHVLDADQDVELQVALHLISSARVLAWKPSLR